VVNRLVSVTTVTFVMAFPVCLTAAKVGVAKVRVRASQSSGYAKNFIACLLEVEILFLTVCGGEG
jgi:hypothetical protein